MCGQIGEQTRTGYGVGWGRRGVELGVKQLGQDGRRGRWGPTQRRRIISASTAATGKLHEAIALFSGYGKHSRKVPGYLTRGAPPTRLDRPQGIYGAPDLIGQGLLREVTQVPKSAQPGTEIASVGRCAHRCRVIE